MKVSVPTWVYQGAVLASIAAGLGIYVARGGTANQNSADISSLTRAVSEVSADVSSLTDNITRLTSTVSTTQGQITGFLSAMTGASPSAIATLSAPQIQFTSAVVAVHAEAGQPQSLHLFASGIPWTVETIRVEPNGELDATSLARQLCQTGSSARTFEALEGISRAAGLDLHVPAYVTWGCVSTASREALQALRADWMKGREVVREATPVPTIVIGSWAELAAELMADPRQRRYSIGD